MEANPPIDQKITPPPSLPLAGIPAEVLMGRLVALYGVTNLQCQNGNWNYDPYMMGLANGMLMAIATMTDSEYNPLSAPDEWLRDRPKFTPEVCDGTGDMTAGFKSVNWKVTAGHAEMRDWRNNQLNIAAEAKNIGHRQWEALYYPFNVKADAVNLGTFKSCNAAQRAIEKRWEADKGMSLG